MFPLCAPLLSPAGFLTVTICRLARTTGRAKAFPMQPDVRGRVLHAGNLSDSELKAMVDTVDEDGSGEIDFEEFLIIMAV